MNENVMSQLDAELQRIFSLEHDRRTFYRPAPF